MLESRNPVNGELLDTYEEMTEQEVDAALASAGAASLSWAEKDFEARARYLERIASILSDDQERWAELIVREMGKPITQAKAEVQKCAWVCGHYAAHAAEYLADEPTATDGKRSYVTFRPLGVVLAVMPWNFPFWQVFRFLAPTLMAGNGAVLKHASNVIGCAFAIEEICKRAELPEDVFRTLPIRARAVERVIAHPVIKAVTLTGSVEAGRSVAAKAGQMLKKTVLELGGSDAYVILADANLKAAVDTCVESRLINSGQSCIAAKRFIVPRESLAQAERLFVEKMSARVVGDPMDPRTNVGPLASSALREQLHEQVTRTVEAGARRLVGGELPDGSGAYYPPTVLSDVQPGMPAYHEELFGPVASIIPVDDEEEAIRVANDSRFGLGAAVFTSDVDRGETIAAKRLQAGSCVVNDFVRSELHAPFGGIKDSGYGRELSSYGIREFVNVKAVSVSELPR